MSDHSSTTAASSHIHFYPYDDYCLDHLTHVRRSLAKDNVSMLEKLQLTLPFITCEVRLSYVKLIQVAIKYIVYLNQVRDGRIPVADTEIRALYLCTGLNEHSQNKVIKGLGDSMEEKEDVREANIDSSNLERALVKELEKEFENPSEAPIVLATNYILYLRYLIGKNDLQPNEDLKILSIQLSSDAKTAILFRSRNEPNRPPRHLGGSFNLTSDNLRTLALNHLRELLPKCNPTDYLATMEIISYTERYIYHLHDIRSKPPYQWSVLVNETSLDEIREKVNDEEPYAVRLHHLFYALPFKCVEQIDEEAFLYLVADYVNYVHKVLQQQTVPFEQSRNLPIPWVQELNNFLSSERAARNL